MIYLWRKFINSIFCAQTLRTLTQNTPSQRSSDRQPPQYLKGVALGIPIYLVAVHMWAWILIAPHFYHRADFRQFYAGAYLIKTGKGKELYEFDKQKEVENQVVSPEPESYELPFVSPSYQALLWAPLTLLPYPAAYVIFALLNVIATGITLKLLWPFTQNLRDVYPWLPVAIAFGFYPVSWAFILGQDSVMLTMILALSLILACHSKTTLSGAVAALALFKLQIILPIGLLFLFWKRWRFSVGFWSTVFLLSVVSVWLTGLAQTRLYVRSLLSIAQLTRTLAPMATHQLLWKTMGNVHGFVFAMLKRVAAQNAIEAVTVGLSASIFAYTVVSGRRTGCEARLLLMAIPCSVLVSHHTYIYDLSVLLIPAMLFLNSSICAEGDKGVASNCALMLIAPTVNCYFPNLSYLLAPIIFLFLLMTSRPDSPGQVAT